MIWLGSDKYVISKWNLSNAAVPHILSADSIRRKDLADDTPHWIVTTKYWGQIDLCQKNFHFPCFQYMLPRLSAYSTEGKVG